MRSYSYFAEFYDSLTRNISYKKFADYIIKLSEKYNHKLGLTLDLACGIGELNIEIAKRGVDIFGIDSSYEMLSKAQEKSELNNLNILFLCQDMRKIDLYGTVDTVICSLDSINHLVEKQDVQNCFDKVSLFLNKGGYFIFDVNTIYKHQNILANNTFVYDTENVYCVWQNQFINQTKCVKINLDFFEKIDTIYYRYSEEFLERAYSFQQIKNFIEKAGMSLIDCFEEFTYNAPNSKSQRVFYVVKKA